MSARRRSPRWTVVTVVAVLAVVLGGLGQAFGSTGKSVKADPPPPLYPGAVVAPLSQQLLAQRARAQQLFAQYRAQHPAGRDDAGFRAWVVGVLPPPAPPAQQQRELAELQQLQTTRTPAGDAAATWLEVYGKKAVWKTYLKDVQETSGKIADQRAQAELKDAVTLANDLVVQLQGAHPQSAPYVVDPALRPDKTVVPGQVCPCSYPSKHGALSAAAVTVLRTLDPHRAGEYDWMAAQVGWSRLYAAGHYRSDLLTGALLGDLVGLYEVSVDGSPALPTSAG